MNEKNSVHKKIEHSPEDKARRKALREKLQRDKPTPEELVASGEYEAPVPHAIVLDMMSLLGMLREAREAAGLRQADVAEKSGIDSATLSRLETGKAHNPTLQTVLRYAHALGKRLVWTLEDEPDKGDGGEDPPPEVDQARVAFLIQKAWFAKMQEVMDKLQEAHRQGLPPRAKEATVRASNRLATFLSSQEHPARTSLESLGRRMDALLAEVTETE